jgi:class 3 adenylate cyclase/tetratricopeptide (TPR) repeat protein
VAVTGDHLLRGDGDAAVAEASRRLAAVMVTDIVGYSALTQRDEANALRLLQEHARIVEPLFSSHGGHAVKGLGDGFLVEFESALEAIRSAVEIQQSFFERNQRPGLTPIQLRIGIHLGDVVHREGDVFGDAVNIASRVQPLAEPGGIVVSGTVVEQVRNKVDVGFLELPPTTLKNIDQAISLFAVELPWLARGRSRVTPWTDRERELDALLGLLEAAGRGDGSVALVSGEAGIGKTRLVEELILRAEKSGFRALRAHGLQAESAPPYSYWAEVARQFLKDLPPPALYKLCGSQTADVLRLVPELAERLGSVPNPPASDPDQERLRFYEGIAQLFENISKQAPIVVFFDDLQWADAATLRVVQHVARRLGAYRIVLVGAYRDTDVDDTRGLRETVLELARQRLATTVALKRLDEGHVDQLVRGMLPGGASFPELARAVFDKTGGNPFFVEEVVRSLVEEGAVVRGPSGWERRAFSEVRLPETVRAVIEARLGRLDAQSLDVLRWAAIIGIEFDFDLLQHVSGVEEGKLFDILDGLLRARLVREGESVRGSPRYLFVDHQIRNTLYEDINRARRRKYHSQVAHAMEAAGAEKRPELAGELAHHYFEGSDRPKALEYTLRAASRAAELYAHEESYRLYQTAFELVEEGADSPRGAEILEALGVEGVRSGHEVEAARYLEEAATILERRQEKAPLARVLGMLCTVEVDHLANLERGMAHGARQLQLLEEIGSTPDLVNAHQELGFMFMATNDYARAREHFARSLELAPQGPDADSEASALQFSGLLMPLERKAEGLRLAEEAIKVGRARGAVRLATKISNYAEAIWKLSGDLETTSRLLRQAREEAIRQGLPGVVASIDAQTALTVELPSGAWAEAQRLAESVLASPLANPSNRAAAMAVLLSLDLRRGEYDRARARFDHWPAPPSLRVDGLENREFPLVELLLARGDLEGAERELARISAAVDPMPLVIQSAYAKTQIAALTVPLEIARGRPDLADAAVARLNDLAERTGEDWSRAVHRTALGRLAAARGAWDESRQAFRAAAGLWAKLRLPYEEGVALVGVARADRALGDTAGAQVSVREARALVERLGARPLLDLLG